MNETTDIRSDLQAPANAALAWLNEQRGSEFELTGLIDAPEMDGLSTQSYEFGLVVCNGEICAREQIKVVPTANGYEFSTVPLEAPEIPPLLDPPIGLRRKWIDEQLGKYEFILLLYYRGRW
ncbi:MAG: hypothetical protein AAF384_05835 [Pseudomonadota bacterium]